MGFFGLSWASPTSAQRTARVGYGLFNWNLDRRGPICVGSKTQPPMSPHAWVQCFYQLSFQPSSLNGGSGAKHRRWNSHDAMQLGRELARMRCAAEGMVPALKKNTLG
jgi:hypothetical protein